MVLVGYSFVNADEKHWPGCGHHLHYQQQQPAAQISIYTRMQYVL